MRAMYDSKTKTMNDYGVRPLLQQDYKYATWLEVESALAKAQGTMGIIPESAAKTIGLVTLDDIDLEEMEVLKERVGHGFMPFIKMLVKACDEEGGKYVHYGVTTQNIQQTSQMLIGKRVHERFLMLLSDMLLNLADLAEAHHDTVMPGRTHGRHAIPITFGYKVSVWIDDVVNAIERLEQAAARAFQVMMGGAVGSFNAMGEEGRRVQTLVAEDLNMGSMDVPSRNITSHKTDYIMALALLAGTCHKIAEEVYTTSIEEIGEIEEGFAEGTIGSSTMPHKRNPKLSKGIIANSLKLYTLPSLCLQAASRPYEADSSQYMVFDAAWDEAIELSTEVFLRAEELTRQLVVHDEKMNENANVNRGLDNSEFIMMKLAEKIGKDQAHSFIYEKAMAAQTTGLSYIDILKQDQELKKYFNEEEIRQMLAPETYTGCGSQIAKEQASKAREVGNQLKGRESHV
ncbi:adenylosuccinate lyase family protein [Rossellomorea marisflavi]|uniref:class-II fumarase/aspartase family protein n=1 Tax=Rossellomorea marisflavi TaxID=189381 RepID=UPI00279B00E3|nr:adenylosuccinate lyase family protein [Rossellomorea marisflavi]UTE72181.1 adenylosuccinate lyase family protein [Rossellomorea marisflavi]